MVGGFNWFFQEKDKKRTMRDEESRQTGFKTGYVPP
jgi:hypothetical protein